MNQSDIDGMLQQSLTDGKLSRAEKSVLRAILTSDADKSPNHMHHKFAVFDDRIAVSGSYNWTRSASEHNQENIMVTNDPKFVQLFRKQFEHLWPQMEPFAEQDFATRRDKRSGRVD